MNIAMIGPYPLQLQYVSGGVESVISTLAPALAELDGISHLHVLSYNNVTKIEKVSLSDKLTIWHYPQQKKLKTLTRSIFERLIITRLVKKIRPDIVHGQGVGIMGYLAISTNPNVVVTAHGIGYVEAQKASTGTLGDTLKILLLKSMMLEVLRKAKAVISTTAYDKTLLHDLVHGKLFSIPNPVLPLFFSRHHTESEEMYILSAGVLVRRKNIEGLLNAFSMIAGNSSANLHIVGPQPDSLYKDEIQKKIDGMGSDIKKRVKLLGFLSNEELAMQIKNCALLSIFSWEETRPTIVSQAMASGKPVIASNVGGISEMISNGQNGFLVSPGDEQALSSSMETLLDSRQLRKEMGKKSFQIAVNEFDARQVAKKTLDCYRTLI